MRTHRFRAMGCDIVVGGADAGEIAAIEQLFAERERVFSRFLPDSELSRVNVSRAEAVAVSPLFASVLARALAAAAATGGLVDPTIGAALAAAGYDRDFGLLAGDPEPAGAATGPRHTCPRHTCPRHTCPRHTWRAVSLVGLLLLRPPGLQLDLNGVVKSLAVDDALALLTGGGFVSAGGDLAARGSCAVGLPGGGTVAVHGGGLATSGTASRSWVHGGRIRHHLIDPRTGLPSGSRWRTVTASGATCLIADVAAKAAFLLGDEGPGWLDERGLAGRFTSPTEVVENLTWHRSVERARHVPQVPA